MEKCSDRINSSEIMKSISSIAKKSKEGSNMKKRNTIVGGVGVGGGGSNSSVSG